MKKVFLEESKWKRKRLIKKKKPRKREKRREVPYLKEFRNNKRNKVHYPQ